MAVPNERSGLLGRLTSLDTWTLIAVVAVVAITSLPRLEDLARRENHEDARRLTSELARAVQDTIDERRLPPPDLGRLLSDRPRLAERIEDLGAADGGRLLGRHGYWFELVHSDAAQRSAGEAAFAVRAWPKDRGRTGRHAYVALPDGRVYERPVGEARWEGGRPTEQNLAFSPEVLERTGWRNLP